MILGGIKVNQLKLIKTLKLLKWPGSFFVIVSLNI